MPKAKGTYLAHRNREIPNVKRGTSYKACQVSFIPSNDPDGFPAVMNADSGLFSTLDKLQAGQMIELVFIETPPFGDNLAVSVEAAV